MPLEPVTWIEAALVSVTVRVSVCPDEMLLVLAVIETVGRAAATLVAKAEIATKVRKGTREGIVFTGACLDICTNCLGDASGEVAGIIPFLRCGRRNDELVRVADSFCAGQLWFRLRSIWTIT